MTSNLLEHSVEDILVTVFDSTPQEVLIINPSAPVLESLVGTEFPSDATTEIKLLGEETTLKTVMDDFIIASRAADLVEADRLQIRTIDLIQPENSLIVTDKLVVALVSIGDTVAGLETADNEFVNMAFDAYQERWGKAAPFTLRTPPMTRVQGTLATEIGEPTASDFTNVLASLQTARGDGNGLDEVTISLLVAAKNNVLLYDISKWGEDVGIASKATFSRTKTRLEDMGLIDTEKVPIDVGRPRLRLKFGDDRLREANTSQLANVAQTLLH